MAARRPEEIHPLFAEAFSAGNLEALMDLYEPGATLVPQPGQPPVSGAQAIREGLQAFLALKPRITIKTASIVVSENIALLRSDWTLTGTGPDGKELRMTNRASEVARRQADGTWRLVIDHPFCAD